MGLGQHGRSHPSKGTDALGAATVKVLEEKCEILSSCWNSVNTEGTLSSARKVIIMQKVLRPAKTRAGVAHEEEGWAGKALMSLQMPGKPESELNYKQENTVGTNSWSYV